LEFDETGNQFLEKVGPRADDTHVTARRWFFSLRLD
jgi:hypothetical protein